MDSFQPTVWPEEAAPAHAIHCQRCELSSQRSRVIWGEGAPGASVMVVLDNPGAREDKEGRAFVCGTRETLQATAFEAGFTPDQLYVTYILKCRPVRAYAKETARGICMSHLREQLAVQSPRVVFCLGNVAVQSYLGDPEAEVKRLRGVWHEAHDRPLLVSYHPLAARRRPALRKLLLEDWLRLRERCEQFSLP